MVVCGKHSLKKNDDGSVTLELDCERCDFFPSVENEPEAMALVIRKIMEVGAPTTVLLKQITEYEYDKQATKALSEIAEVALTLLNEYNKQKFLQYKEDKNFFLPRTGKINEILNETIFSDPIAAYIEIIRLHQLDKNIPKTQLPNTIIYASYSNFLRTAKTLLERTILLQETRPSPSRYKVGERELYKRVFKATTKPDFMRSKVQAPYPADGEILESYSVKDPLLRQIIAEVTIFKLPHSEQKMYHVIPVEANLSWEKYKLLHEAKQTYENRPEGDIEKNTAAYLENPRGYLFKLAQGLLVDIAKVSRIELNEREVEQLASILVRNMVGFGIIEIFLTDKKVQDVVINSPVGTTPIYIKMRGFEECLTNIYPTSEEVESWATRLRFLSGRSLDEAHPILDTDKLEIPGNFRSRTAIITSPLNAIKGEYAFAIRQHAPDPVTLARYSQSDEQFKTQAKRNKEWAAKAWGAMMLAPSKQMKGLPFAAGLLSFLIDGNRTFLVAGTRSSGKTTLLSSILVNLSRKVRIVTIEDTLEIPGTQLKTLGYNIQSLKVRSALARGTTEVSAEEGIRSTLRLGDSSLILGEVRSSEAKSLYEAMRIGALANVVAGTIHANDPYGVFDRVVNDLEVPATSFKATDVILMARPLPYKGKRVTSITEVRKLWDKDPLTENGFVDLVHYDHEKDSLDPSDAIKNGDSDLLKEIGARIDAFAGNWNAIWDNILLRSKIIQYIIDTAVKENNPGFLQAPFYINAWDAFREISSEVYHESKTKKGVGEFPPKEIYTRWTTLINASVAQERTR